MASTRPPEPASHTASLHDEPDLARALFESLGEGVYVVDREGRLSAMNPAAEHLLGWTADELAGSDVHERIHFRDDQGALVPREGCPLLRVAKTGEPARGDDDVFVRRDGSTLPVAWSSHPLRRDGEVIGAVVAFRDITVFKRRQDAEHQARLRAEVLARARALPDSMRVDARADTLVRAIAPGLADYALIHLGDGDHAPRLLAVAHADRAREQLVRDIHDRHPPDPAAPRGVAAVIRTGRPEIIPTVTPEVLDALARSDDHRALLERLEPRSALILPLTARGRTLGALTLVSSTGHYSGDTIELAVQVADQAALVIDNARLFADRSQAAEELQRALLPSDLPDVPGARVAARYRPAGRGIEAGGDFFDVLDVGDGQYTLLIGDVAGKGPKAAALTGLVRHTAQGAAAAGAPGARVLQLANDALLRHGDASEFCTAVYGCVTAREGRLDVQLRCAGHPPPLVVRADGTVSAVEARGPLLGVGGLGEWPELPVTLGAGDLLVLYTDGAIELRGRDPYRGERELRELLATLGGVAPAEVLERIEHHVLVANRGEPRDDLALLAVQADPGATGRGP